MPLASFRKMNESREERGLATFANPRNATAGTVRQLEPSITAHGGCTTLPTQLLKDGRTYFDRHSKALATLQAAGFKVNPITRRSRISKKSGNSSTWKASATVCRTN